MSKSAKKRRADKRKMMKRAKKSAKAALYKSYAEQGRKNNSKRSQKGRRTAGPNKGNHVMVNCGNVGCQRCFPRYTIRVSGAITGSV